MSARRGSKPGEVQAYSFHADLCFKVMNWKGQKRLYIGPRSSGRYGLMGRDFPSDSQVRNLRRWLGQYLAMRKESAKLENAKAIRAHANSVKRIADELISEEGSK